MRVLDRHESSCSTRLLQAAEPSTRSFRRTARGTKAPARSGGYHPEHIPAFLEQDWYQKHLADLQCHSHVKTMRRVGAVLLVQWAAGGSMGDAAAFLGINLTGGQYAATSGFYQWLNNDDSGRFTHALTAIAGDLDSSVDLTDYQRRREALRGWSLAPDTWNDIVAELPPVPGPVRPNLDDRKRQEASAFVWAHVTRGEPRFAPRPIDRPARPCASGLAPTTLQHVVPTFTAGSAQPLRGSAATPRPTRGGSHQQDRCLSARLSINVDVNPAQLKPNLQELHLRQRPYQAIVAQFPDQLTSPRQRGRRDLPKDLQSWDETGKRIDQPQPDGSVRRE
ncbi:hypothetical protein KCMC57_up58490 [Kitasatospora sp. CMC57]|uniref:DUF4375 domain-containing protein n=1 Tax=Kitasatospora sp. CMC57 TaxID=3231513 RepID=A0AB33K2L9_9ACTN